MCSPTSVLSKVDLPALGRPMSAAKPDLYFSTELTSKHEIAFGLRPRRRRSFRDVSLIIRRLSRFLNSDARDAALVGLDHFKTKSAERDLFSDRGQVAELIDDQAGDCCEIVGGQFGVESAFDLADFDVA